MHKLSKGPIPKELRDFCRANPTCRDWNSFYSNYHDSYKVLKKQIFTEQNFLCAYCEEQLAETENTKQRIEHFHPKEDKSSERNWAFDWSNMIGVCTGGSQERPTVLHCDAKKEQNVAYDLCEGFLLNPLDMPAACLFSINRATGELQANTRKCQTVFVCHNKFQTVAELVENTIKVLNLNCDKLNKKRLVVIREFERLRKSLRQNSSTTSSVRSKIAERWFSSSPPSFFTTRRILLGEYAEQILSQQGYNN